MRGFTKSWCREAVKLQQFGTVRYPEGTRYIVVCEEGVVCFSPKGIKLAGGKTPATIIDETSAYQFKHSKKYIDYGLSEGFTRKSYYRIEEKETTKSILEVSEHLRERAERVLGDKCYVVEIQAPWQWLEVEEKYSKKEK